MERRQFLTTALAATAATTVCTQSELAMAKGRRKRVKHPPWAKVQAENAATLKALLKPTPGKPLLKWEWLVMHHTAAEYASLKGVSNYHRRRFRDPLGIQYHFLIGNGKRAPRGLIQVARWAHQERAIHLFKPEGAPHAVTVCLTGNLEKRHLHKEEFEAITLLGRVLTQGLGIPIERVTTHRGVDGRLTQCPGKHFPLKRFTKALVVAPVAPTVKPG